MNFTPISSSKNLESISISNSSKSIFQRIPKFIKLFFGDCGDKAWDLIERKAMGQDVNLDDLYPEHFIIEETSLKYIENIQPLLLSGEQCYMFDGECDNYCITSYGRIFNANLITQSKVYFALDNIKVCVRLTKINFATELV